MWGKTWGDEISKPGAPQSPQQSRDTVAYLTLIRVILMISNIVWEALLAFDHIFWVGQKRGHVV